MRNLTVLNGSSHPQLGNDICKRLGIPPGQVTLRKFSNQETNVEIGESVRGAEVFIVQSGCGNVNDNFMELLILIAACRTASASKITAVIPSFPYARQPGATDRKNGTFLTRLGPEDVDKYKGMYGGALPQTPEPRFLLATAPSVSATNVAVAPAPVAVSALTQSRLAAAASATSNPVSPAGPQPVPLKLAAFGKVRRFVSWFARPPPSPLTPKLHHVRSFNSLDTLHSIVTATATTPSFPLAAATVVPASSPLSPLGSFLFVEQKASRSSTSIPEGVELSALAATSLTSEDLLHATSPPSKPRSIQTRTESVPSVDGLKDTTRVSTISISQSNIVVTPLTVPKEKQSSALVFPTIGTNASGATAAGGYKHWTARSGTLIANLLVTAGADHVITMDLHDPQFQGFFDIPVDNLYSQPLILRYIKENIPKYQSAVIVSPDAGGAKRATLIADKLSMDFALIHRERRRKAQSRSMSVTTLAGPVFVSDMMIVGDVKGRTCVLIDDIADTSITITQAAKILKQNGATKIYAVITHAMMSGDALDRINESPIDEVIVSNTIPQDEHIKKCSKIRVFDVAPLFAEAIRRIHNGESVELKDDNIFEWRVGIIGPLETIYEGGFFLVSDHEPKKIYTDGRLCISILHPPGDDPTSGERAEERWNPTQTVESILLSVVSLLNDPNVSSPANVDAGVLFRNDRSAYEKKVKEQVELSKKDIPSDLEMPKSAADFQIKRPAPAKEDDDAF
ncbi:ribose-phosphate pyrophosphokinase, partial [Physocladia obscura]